MRVLLFGCFVLTHALSRFLDLAQDILPCQIARADYTHANGKIGPVAPEPAA